MKKHRMITVYFGMRLLLLFLVLLLTLTGCNVPTLPAETTGDGTTADMTQTAETPDTGDTTLQPADDRVATRLAELLPWIDEVNAQEVISLKITTRYFGVQPGRFVYHQYITDQERIEKILSVLRSAEATPISEKETEIVGGGGVSYYLLTEQAQYLLSTGNSILYTQDSYWRVAPLVAHYEGQPVQYSFGMLRDECEVYDGEELLGTFAEKIEDIEFVPAPEYDPSAAPGKVLAVRCAFFSEDVFLYDATHFSFEGVTYVIVSEADFGFAYSSDTD